jgi:hypothetical protein
MGASHPTRVHCWELACRDQKGIRSTIPLEFRRLKQRRETWWERLRRSSGEPATPLHDRHRHGHNVVDQGEGRWHLPILQRAGAGEAG